MGQPTLTNLPRTGLLENPALWDFDASDDGNEIPGTTDYLASFSAAIINVRWATAAASLILSASAVISREWVVIVSLIGVLLYTIRRSFVPLEYNGSPSDQAWLLVEVTLFWLMIAATGFWQSPLVITISGILVVSGFAGGFRMALRIGAATAASLTIVGFTLTDWTTDDMAEAVQWTTLLLLTGVVAGYGRRISGEATRQHSVALGRLSQLNDANTLLFNLHRLAQSLPASLNQSEVLDSSLTELRGLIDFDRAVLLLLEETDKTWVVARQQAFGLEGAVDPVTLPAPAKACMTTWRTAFNNNLGADIPGLHPESRSGLFAPLAARDRLIGLVILESQNSDHYGERQRRALQGLIEPMALAIDNAGWFGRLRRVSVAEERSRIARELHDRVGQSLAAIGFDIDRLLRYHDEEKDLGPDLERLQQEVRSMTSEVRHALYDLRSDVAEKKDFEQTIGEFATRVAERSDLTINVESDSSCRLPIQQEREMWRIAQEALINVERHANASTATVRWRCDRTQAALDVIDDGCGMTEKGAGRTDSYGIVGMRERANSIGAALEIISAPGEGTTVRCYLNQI